MRNGNFLAVGFTARDVNGYRLAWRSNWATHALSVGAWNRRRTVGIHRRETTLRGPSRGKLRNNVAALRLAAWNVDRSRSSRRGDWATHVVSVGAVDGRITARGTTRRIYSRNIATVWLAAWNENRHRSSRKSD